MSSQNLDLKIERLNLGGNRKFDLMFLSHADFQDASMVMFLTFYVTSYVLSYILISYVNQHPSAILTSIKEVCASYFKWRPHFVQAQLCKIPHSSRALATKLPLVSPSWARQDPSILRPEVNRNLFMKTESFDVRLPPTMISLAHIKYFEPVLSYFLLL